MGGALTLEFKVKAPLATWVSAATAATTGHVEGKCQGGGGGCFPGGVLLPQ